MENLADLREAIVDIVIDHDVVVAVPVTDLGLGPGHAAFDYFVAVLRPRDQAAMQFVQTGGKDEYADYVLLILLLAFRPYGLFGLSQETRL